VLFFQAFGFRPHSDQAPRPSGGQYGALMSAMVVGGAGFIGSHLVDRLLAGGENVDVVDDLTAGGLANLAEARAAGGTLKIHHLDASSAETASLIGMRKPEVLYHLAAIPRHNVTNESLGGAFNTTMAIIDACRAHRIDKIVIALPASALYGQPPAKSLPLKEQPLEPRGIRGVIARATVDLLVAHRELYALEFTVLAFTSVYGPRQAASGGVIGALAAAVRDNAVPTITGDGRQTRDFLFVDDAVDALVRAGSRGSGLVVNIGTGVQTPVLDVWQMMSGTSGERPKVAPAPVDEVSRFAVSPIRARIHLSWSPWTSLSDGLGQLE
jgi:UDP-glucose 4-epimerase